MAAVAAQSFDRQVAETQISKTDVNNVIMDYLITEGYPSAAEKFALEANIERRVDHGSIQQRVLIRDSIHRGDLQEAIEMINDLNPDLLDRDNRLHFSLLRLQLVELIRSAFTSTTPTARPDPTRTSKAIEFAQQNLAPYATLDPHFKYDLERAMALLIVPRESWTQHQSQAVASSSSSSLPPQSRNPASNFGQLASLVDPSLRQDVAKDVNEAILRAQGERKDANIRFLVKTRAWAENLARDTRKIDLPERLSIGLDGDEVTTAGEESNNGENGHDDTEMGENGADGEAGDNAPARTPSTATRANAPRRARLTSGASAGSTG